MVGNADTCVDRGNMSILRSITNLSTYMADYVHAEVVEVIVLPMPGTECTNTDTRNGSLNKNIKVYPNSTQ